MKNPGAPLVSSGVVPREGAAMLRRLLAAVMILTTVLGAASSARASAADIDAEAADPTPPRLSYTAGSVSFWRPGGDDWAPAQVNTPLAEGDELYTARDGNLELQVGARAFVRAWGDTQLGLLAQDAHFLQFRVAAGHVVLDLHTLEAGEAVEIDTPAAAFIVERPGYYRVDVTAERTAFSTRRSGRATMTTASGPAPAVEAGESVVVEGGSVRRLAAPDPDVWDRWNDARTAALVAPVSARHVPAQVYGVSELERHGSWRSDPTYGSLWVPAGVAPDWAPYSSGRWIWDPHFGWTWLDAAPWGWAPYHYGRWVYLGGVWGWAPGPIVVRPAYAPALVAFFGTPTVGVHVVGPSIGWVALGWGEPVVPWWGQPHFVGRPWWGGWGGPRVKHVTVYRNVTVVNAVVAVRSDHFGRRGVHEARIPRLDVRRLQPVRGRLDVTPQPESFRGRDGHARRPPEGQTSRRVVSTRPPGLRPDPFGVRDDRRDAHPDVRREGRPAARPGDPRDGTRDQRPEAARPEQPRDGAPRPGMPRVPSPRTTPRQPDAPRGESPRATPRQPAPPRGAAPRPEAPRVEPPRAAPRPETPRVAPPRDAASRPEAPRMESPRAAPRPETPRVAPPRDAAPRPEAPRMESPRAAPRPEAPRVAPSRAGAPRPEPPRVEPRRPGVPRVDPRGPEVPREEPRSDIRRPGPPRGEALRNETPRRAGMSDNRRGPGATRPAVQRRPEAGGRVPRGPAAPDARPARGAQRDGGPQGR
jgi:hypothetical protein